MHPQQAHALAAQHRDRLLTEAQPRRRAGDVMAVDSTPLCVRPVTDDDHDRLRRLFARLSPRSIRLRYFSPIRELSDAQIARFIDVDHQCHELLVALRGDEIVAEARYDGDCATGEAEIALTVEDTWQHRGVGVRLARRLMGLAAERGFDRLVANILPENEPALGLVRELAPDASVRWDSGTYVATIPLELRQSC
jgi:GNAT superfamily N-acetyltransferase